MSNPVDEVMTAQAVLSDWLGDGGHPVHQMLSEFRAQRCLHGNNGDACPHNVQPNWWDKVKSKIADWIKAELELKNGRGIRVAEEEKLAMCSQCGCCLRLKVHVPREHLIKHLDPKTFEKAPPYCWLKKELTT